MAPLLVSKRALPPDLLDTGNRVLKPKSMMSKASRNITAKAYLLSPSLNVLRKDVVIEKALSEMHDSPDRYLDNDSNIEINISDPLTEEPHTTNSTKNSRDQGVKDNHNVAGLMDPVKGLLDLTNDYLKNLEAQHPGIGADFLALLADGASRAMRVERETWAEKAKNKNPCIKVYSLKRQVVKSVAPQGQGKEVLRARPDLELTGNNRIQETPVLSTTRSALPKWNGNLEDFGFYICKLEARIKREWASFVDPCSICLDMIDTLPDDKKLRIAAWFQESSRLNNFSWKDLIEHFHRQFDDKEARQSASECVNRMEQGYNQLFIDFLKDFEYHITPCSATFTPLEKPMQLKASLNNRLRKALVVLKMPPLENYDAWVEEVCEVAADLEGLNDYRSKNAKYTITKLEAPKGIYVPEVHKDINLDADGDYKMGENSLIAELNDLSKKGSQEERSFKKGSLGKPRAPWRSEEEFYNLVKKGLRVRCKISGHKSQYCRKFGPPIRPKASVGAMEEQSDVFSMDELSVAFGPRQEIGITDKIEISEAVDLLAELICYFSTKRLLDERQVRYNDLIHRFNFELIWPPATACERPDALSRRDQDKIGDLSDERTAGRNMRLLPPVSANPAIVISGDDDSGSSVDPAAQTRLVISDKEWRRARDAVTARERSFPPDLAFKLTLNIAECSVAADNVLRAIMQNIHNSYLTGHPRKDTMVDIILRRWFWPKLRDSVRGFIQNCDVCGRTSICREAKAGFLRLFPIPEHHLSKDIFAFGTKSMTLEKCAEIFVDRYYRYFGFPRYLTSDRGSDWTSHFWRTFCQLTGISQRLTTAYHPQANASEHANQEIYKYLRVFICYAQSKWTS
ncbi:hypothetical protein EPUL_000238 [Erysiphe pulchra]|uniref:Integrase catalytic domain-containing protein n=1 Tax=Erysiphe pulchra TaxID=225359 RepID=A0A2S4PZH0_9PEZI|nr:hypothetical protein EPUL_000238 [Erysiphe pulchra]